MEGSNVLTFLARMKVKADREEEYVRLTKELTEKVRANEPGCTFYEFYKLRDEPLGYAVFEQFVDEKAEELHLETPYFQEIAPPLLECLDGTYVREYLEVLD